MCRLKAMALPGALQMAVRADGSRGMAERSCQENQPRNSGRENIEKKYLLFLPSYDRI